MSLDAIRRQIDAAMAEPRLGRGSVTLVAVSKQQPDDRVDALLAQGQRVFGENRVQEAQARWQARREKYPDLQLHMIGHLQTNKAAEAVALFDVIETLDSARLAAALAAEMKKQNRRLACFIQVNTGAEDQKDGIAPADLPALLAAARADGIEVTGLMCIPPQDDVPALHFALLRQLAAEHGLPNLSMGMSADFPAAIACGATHVRVGSALFGDRN